MIFLLSSSLEQQGIPYRAAKQICIKGRSFQKGESFANHARHQALAQCEAQQLNGINCLIVKSDDMVTIWREIPRHQVVMTAARSIRDFPVADRIIEEGGFFNRSPFPEKSNHATRTKAKHLSSSGPNEKRPTQVKRLLDWIVDV